MNDPLMPDYEDPDTHEKRSGQILWVRGLTRLQTQVRRFYAEGRVLQWLRTPCESHRVEAEDDKSCFSLRAWDYCCNQRTSLCNGILRWLPRQHAFHSRFSKCRGRELVAFARSITVWRHDSLSRLSF